jgi:hypothetical protein
MKVKKKVRAMVKGYVDEVSAVDSPAAEGALAVLAKRAPERLAKALADADRVLQGEESAGADELEETLLDVCRKAATPGEHEAEVLLRLVGQDARISALAEAAARARGCGEGEGLQALLRRSTRRWRASGAGASAPRRPGYRSTSKRAPLPSPPSITNS